MIRVIKVAYDLPLPFGSFLWLVSGLHLRFMVSSIHFVPQPVIFTRNVRSVLNDQGVVGLQPHVFRNLQEAVDGRDLLLSDAPFLKQVLAC